MRKALELRDRENNPEDYNPSFKPDTQVSQVKVRGRKPQEGNFLNQQDNWQYRREQKLARLQS